MKHASILLCLLAVLLLLPSCSAVPDRTEPQSQTNPFPSFPDDTETFTVTDDLGRTISLLRPKRVAVMIGSFADVWCLAGGRNSLVAAANDAWTSFDLELGSDVTDLGAIKTPNLELLLGSQPDLVIASCNTTSNLALLETLDSAQIPVLYFDVQSFDDYLHMLEICTALTGQEDRYIQYGLNVAEQVQNAIARQDDSHPSVLCIRATGSSCSVKKSTDNLLGEMLAALGCRNVADSENSTLENLTMEAIMASDPDYIFTVLQGSDSAPAMETLKNALLSNPAWNSLRAVSEGRFYVLENSLYNLKPNSRWGESYEKLSEILYPTSE